MRSLISPPRIINAIRNRGHVVSFHSFGIFLTLLKQEYFRDEILIVFPA